jgi:hypothetical protein
MPLFLIPLLEVFAAAVVGAVGAAVGVRVASEILGEGDDDDEEEEVV